MLDEKPLAHLLMISASLAKMSGRKFDGPDYFQRETLEKLSGLHAKAAN